MRPSKGTQSKKKRVKHRLDLKRRGDSRYNTAGETEVLSCGRCVRSSSEKGRKMGRPVREKGRQATWETKSEDEYALVYVQ